MVSTRCPLLVLRAIVGKVKPQAILPYRINAQYIMEGACGGLFYTLGGARCLLLLHIFGASIDVSRVWAKLRR
jgi:hypothetical protein